MIGLLKADFRRLFKDKLLLVMGILAVVFAVSTPLLYAGLFSAMGMTEEEMELMMAAGLSPTGKSLFFIAFSLGDNLGLIAPVLLAIALWKDFSYGTVRNKVISGKSRSAIFMSLFITCATVFIAVMMLYAFITLGVSLLFFPYQAETFTAKDFGYLMASLGFELLILLYVAAMLSWLCVSMKNIGLVIVLYIAFSLFITITGGIVQAASIVVEMFEAPKFFSDLFYFLDRINIGMATSFMATHTAYNWKDVLYLTVPAVFGISGFLGLGLWQFNRKDLK